MPTIKIRNLNVECKVHHKDGDQFLVSYYFAGIARAIWAEREWLVFPKFGDYVI